MLNKKNVVIALLFVLGCSKNILSMEQRKRFACVESFYVPRLQDITRIKLSSDGKYIAFGSEKGIVFIYDCINKRPKCFYKHDNSIVALGFSPDCKYVFSVSANDGFSTNKNFKVYSLENKKVVYTKTCRFKPRMMFLSNDYDAISMIAGNGDFEQDKTSSDMQIKLYANNKRNEKGRIFQNNLLESATKKQLSDIAIFCECTMDPMNIDQIDADAMDIDQDMSDNEFDYVSFSKKRYKNKPMTASDYMQPKRKKRKRDAYQGSMELDLFEQEHKRIKKKRKLAEKIWERFALLYKRNLSIPNAGITSLDVSADGTYVAVGYSNGFVGILNLQTKRPLYSYGHACHIRYVRFSQDGKYLLSLSKDGSLRVCSLRSKNILYVCKNNNVIIDFCLSKDATEIVLLLGNGKYERYKIAPEMSMSLEVDNQKENQKRLFKKALLENKKENRFTDLCITCVDSEKMDTSDDEIGRLSTKFQSLSIHDNTNNDMPFVFDNGNNVSVSFDEKKDSDYQMESDDEDSDVEFLDKPSPRKKETKKRKRGNDNPMLEDVEFEIDPFRLKKRQKRK